MSITATTLTTWRCPACRARLTLDRSAIVCTNADCRRCYQVIDGIPVMLIDQATVMDEAAWKAVVARPQP